MEKRKVGDAGVRVGVLTAAPALLMSFGVGSADALAKAGLPSDLLDDSDNRIAYGARGRLLNVCAAMTRCEHFGLLLGQHGRLSHLGLVGFLVQHSPDVGTALRNLERYLQLHVRGGTPRLTVSDGRAVLGYEIHESDNEGREQVEDAAMAVACSILRSLCSASWKPLEAVFTHSRPRDTRPFSRFFRAPLRFDAMQNGIAFSADWLTRPLPKADDELRRLLQKQVDALDGGPTATFPDRVRSVLRTAILTGHGAVEDIAPMFAMHSRTMHRQLAEFSVTFKVLADETRLELARRMLEGSATPISQIAEALDYADASAFTRAFRRWTKTTPAAWRAAGGDTKYSRLRRAAGPAPPRGRPPPSV
jgi:AraC-like DNA-binding protein